MNMRNDEFLPEVVPHSAHFDNVYVFDEETEWDSWIDRVEAELGHDLDGDIDEDGYSMDTFYEMWKDGWTVDEAVNATPEDHLSV